MTDHTFEEGLALSSDESDYIGEDFFNKSSSNPESEKEFENIEDYIFDENPAYENSNSLEISSFIRLLKRKHTELTTFKKVSTYGVSVDQLKPFVEYMKLHPGKAKDVILDGDIFYPMTDMEYPYYNGFTLIDEDFALVYKRDYIRNVPTAFLFFNDYKIVMEKFFKDDIRKQPAGIYELGVKNNKYILKPLEIKYVEDPILEESTKEKIDKDIETFLKNKKFYKENNLPHKRGIIIHGPHGNGKTSTVKSIIKNYDKTVRVLIDCRIFESDLSDFLNKSFDSDIDKIIVFEDVESISEGGSRSYGKRSSFLNFIDGPKTMDNTLFIATTNHPDLVDPALIDRPSRFDRIYKVDLPNKDSRKKFLLKYFPELEKDEKRLEKCVEESKDFSGAYFKELFIVVGIQESSIEDAIADLKKQIKVRRGGKFEGNAHSVGLNRHYDD